MELIDIQKELERLAKKEEQLNKEKERLLEVQRQNEEQKQKVVSIYENSGFTSPESLIKALCEVYQFRPFGRAGKRESISQNSTRKPRKRVTPELVKNIKDALKAGFNRNQVAKKFDLSYPTVSKIHEGQYDKLV